MRPTQALMHIIDTPSPNFNTREGHGVDMLVLHYTGMRSGAAALDRLCEPGAEVSAHYLVDEMGIINRLVAEDMRAWHAGISYWRGHRNINQRSIGIEMVNPGHEFGYRPFPEAQMQSVVALCVDILSRHTIPARNVVGHSDVAPTRKQDPGELFDWERLARAGVGLFPEMDGSGAGGADVSELADYGYDLSDERAAIIAFQRHFRPTAMTGIWDEESGLLLRALRHAV